MITLTPPGPALARTYHDTAGGFAWWYADVVDAAGNGVVVIAGFGLPFLPGLASAARAGRPVPPASRPSVNLAVYEAGRCTWYGLLELSPSSCSWSSDGAADPEVVEEQRMGASRLLRRVKGGVASFEAELDLVLPCGRARGTISVRGRARDVDEHARLDVGVHDDATQVPRHDWSPQILCAAGHVDLVLGDAAFGAPERRVIVRGTGYHDRNGARAPLHALGLDHWCWVRASFGHEDRVLYALSPNDGTPPRAFGLIVDEHGTRVVDGLVLDVRRQPRNWLGLRRIDELVAYEGDTSFLHVRAVHLVDDGPFYARALCAASTSASTMSSIMGQGPSRDAIAGVIETVAPDRVDVAWQRPFVHMRVTPSSSSAVRASLWHPLFAGDVGGRFGRLFRSLVRSPQGKPT
jgi:hypothetical protein